MNFEAYKEWSKQQPCIDCGKLKDGDLWATEIQCFECFKKYGNTESRGLSSAREVVKRCYDCKRYIVAEDDDALVCIECGGRNRLAVIPAA